VPSRNTSPQTRKHSEADAGLERLADAIEELKPGAVEVIGGFDLTPTLITRGITTAGTDTPAAADFALAVVAATDDHSEQIIDKLKGDGFGRLLLWRLDDGSLAGWISVAASRGYFRAPEQLTVDGVTCVLLSVGEPSAAELVARYEAMLADRPALDQQLTELRHQVLTSRDFAIGAEAEIAGLQADVDRFKAALDEVYSSTSWLVIRRGIAPMGKRLKRIGSRSR